MTTNPHDHHNQGQEDRSDGQPYEEPHSFVREVGASIPIVGGLFGDYDQIVEDNQAYRAGWQNAKNQE
jgi:hypothetical protein